MLMSARECFTSMPLEMTNGCGLPLAQFLFVIGQRGEGMKVILADMKDDTLVFWFAIGGFSYEPLKIQSHGTGRQSGEFFRRPQSLVGRRWLLRLPREDCRQLINSISITTDIILYHAFQPAIKPVGRYTQALACSDDEQLDDGFREDPYTCVRLLWLDND